MQYSLRTCLWYDQAFSSYLAILDLRWRLSLMIIICICKIKEKVVRITGYILAYATRVSGISCPLS